MNLRPTTNNVKNCSASIYVSSDIHYRCVNLALCASKISSLRRHVLNLQILLLISTVHVHVCHISSTYKFDDLYQLYMYMHAKLTKVSNQRCRKKKEQTADSISEPMLLEQYIAIADYKKEAAKEVNLREGQMVEVIEKNEMGMYQCGGVHVLLVGY